MGRDIHLWPEPLDTNSVAVYGTPVPAPYGYAAPVPFAVPTFTGRVGQSGALNGNQANR